MSGWESLYHTATGDYNNGNYKDSYTNYLKVANALLSKLSNEVSFANKDTVKNKPRNTAHLLTQLKSCVQKLEDILQNRVTNRILSSPQPSYSSDLATSIITANPTPQHLPLIPFSPLTRQSLHYAHQLATTSQKVSIIKQKSSDNNNQDDLSILRKLDEEIRQHKNKLDHVNNQIQSISEVPLTFWDTNEVSKQLTIIESELYKKVDFKKDLTLIRDKRTSKAQACMDFHRYLTNSFIHQFMIYADATRSSVNPPRGTQNRENIIAHAIKVAYLLLNVYRNFNSFAALMKALTSPEVRRIRRLWTNLGNRTQLLKEYSSLIKKEDNDYKAYKEILVQKMESFRDIGQGMQEVQEKVVVIPWMQPHYEEIKVITQSYTSGKSGDNTEVILSAPGQHKLASIFSLLEQCRTNVISDDELRSNNFNGTRKANMHKTIDGISLSQDLSCMGNGNLELHHWLVSRVYLTKQQLIDESMEIEPLGESEHPLCVENEYEEEEGEESDHNSVGRYDIGSEYSGDNIEAGTSSNHEVTNGSSSQSNKPSPNKSEEHNSLQFPHHERSESGSKSVINGTSSLSREISKSEINLEIMENDSIGTNSLVKTSDSTIENTTFSSFTSSSKTQAIPIPQPAGQKSHQPSVSPASSMLTNLNPNAMPFVPRSISSSAPGTTLDMRNISTSLEMGEKNKITKSATEEDDDDGGFIYPVNDSKSDEEDDDNESPFVYKPPEATSSNGLKDNADGDEDIFIYSEDKEEKSTYSDGKNSQDEQDEQDENDDGEGSSFVYPNPDNTGSDQNNINISRNSINGAPAIVDKPDSITVKFSELQQSKVQDTL